jgi:hypothetical protein
MDAQRTTVTKYRFNKTKGGFIPTGMTITIHDVVSVPEVAKPMPVQDNSETVAEVQEKAKVKLT